MHLLIPFAFGSSEGCQQALRSLKLPHLDQLLRRLTPEAPDTGDALSLSPPHERALARALGLATQDGMLPWACVQVAQATDAALTDDNACAFITPCHWQVSSGHIAMSGQALSDWSAHESHALLAAMQPYFAQDGLTLQYDQPSRWLATGALLQGLATASLDRVAGRDIAHWLPRGAHAGAVQRLQSEMQMLLYTHPVNEARAARGVVPVNSFWLSGTGTLPAGWQAAAAGPAPQVVTRLRDAALHEDWAAWANAWLALDATECAALLAALNRTREPNQPGIKLTLCGERSAQTFTAQPQATFTKFMNIFARKRSSNVLEQL